MSKRSVFTTITPLPAGISRATVVETLHSHTEMIDLNPLVIERHPIKPPREATAEEYHCAWYSITDKVQYLPGGLAKGSVVYNGCFHDLPTGLQTHVNAPLGLDIKSKWTCCGTLPGEPVVPVELGLGAPMTGLYLREDIDMRCNMILTGFVKKTLKKAHAHLVDRLLVKAQIMEGSMHNERLSAANEQKMRTASYIASQSSMSYAESSADSESTHDRDDGMSMAGSNYGRGNHSPGFNPQGGPHSPPLTPGFAPQQMQYSEPSRASQGLNVRASGSSFQSAPDNRTPYSGGSGGGKNSPRIVSWQNLNSPRHSPSSFGADPAYQQANPYAGVNGSQSAARHQSYQGPLAPQQQQLSAQASRPAELCTEGRRRSEVARPVRDIHEMQG